MHLLYVDESGETGVDLHTKEQPVFVMAGLAVSDEKWRKTEGFVAVAVSKALGEELPDGFELHACDLLAPAGCGFFEGMDRDRRNALALDLLEIVAERHQLFISAIHKKRLVELPPPTTPWDAAWDVPWQIGFAVVLTMFEDFLQGPNTGVTSRGLVIVDHHPQYLDVVRQHSFARRQAPGWRRIKKVIEVGYSIESHANPLIQLTDLVAFVVRKAAELELGYGTSWPEPAKHFFLECRRRIWPKVQYKMLKFKKLKVPSGITVHLKAVRT